MAAWTRMGAAEVLVLTRSGFSLSPWATLLPEIMPSSYFCLLCSLSSFSLFMDYSGKQDVRPQLAECC